MNSGVFGKRLPNKDYHGIEVIYLLLYNNKSQVGIINEGDLYKLPSVILEGYKDWQIQVFRKIYKLTGCIVTLEDFIGKVIYYKNNNNTNEYYREEGHFFNARVSKNNVCNKKLEWVDCLTAREKIKSPHQLWALENNILA